MTNGLITTQTQTACNTNGEQDDAHRRCACLPDFWETKAIVLWCLISLNATFCHVTNWPREEAQGSVGCVIEVR
jgi:hypothetical protein